MAENRKYLEAGPVCRPPAQYLTAMGGVRFDRQATRSIAEDSACLLSWGGAVTSCSTYDGLYRLELVGACRTDGLADVEIASATPAPKPNAASGHALRAVGKDAEKPCWRLDRKGR